MEFRFYWLLTHIAFIYINFQFLRNFILKRKIRSLVITYFKVFQRILFKNTWNFLVLTCMFYKLFIIHIIIFQKLDEF